MLIDAHRLNERLAVFLGIFIFVSGFLFSLNTVIPTRYGFTVAESQFMSLVSGSAIFTIGSFFAVAIDNHFKNMYQFKSKILRFILKNTSLLCDIAVVSILVLSLFLTPALKIMPPFYFNLMLIGISYGLTCNLVFRAIIPNLRKRTDLQVV